MLTATDFLVRSADGAPQLVVEAKTKAPATIEWADRFRRNILADAATPQTKFFLFALPERSYLWKDAPVTGSALPNYEIDTRSILQPYTEGLRTPLSELSESSFELLIELWLQEIVSGRLDSSRLPSSAGWLSDSGLLDAIRHGSISSQALS